MLIHNNQTPIEKPKNRDSFYLIYSILKILETKQDEELGTSRTNIVYRTYASHSEIKKYLNMLVDRELISVNYKGNRESYMLTEKGIKCLNLIREFVEILPHQFAKDFDKDYD